MIISNLHSGQNSTLNSTKIKLLEGIDFAFEPYKTWGHTLEVIDLLLVATPKSTDEVVAIVNWARAEGRKVRARGYKHSYPPLTVTRDADPSKVVLLDFTKHLTKLQMSSIPADQTITSQPLKTVTVETGTAWGDLMSFLEQNNVGLIHSLIIGDATVGGVLAIGAHGAAIPAKGEPHQAGFSYGSLSNLITGFKAVVWDDDKKAYGLKTFSRVDPDSRPFLTHVGRALLTEVSLIVGENYNLRCRSVTDIPADELFASPEHISNTTRSFVSFLDETGRADVQWYQFTKNPWLKLWSVEPSKPAPCVEVSRPYNYQFPVNINDPSKTVPELGEIAYTNLLNGLSSTNASDIWGPSKNILLYSNGTSRPIIYGGFVVLTTRDKLQEILSRVVNFYKSLNEEYAKKSEYPIDYYIKFRVTSVDNATETLIKDAQSTVFSPVSPSKKYPHFNTALWMNTFTGKDNQLGSQFMRRFEAFYFNTFNGTDGLARVEWSKSWGYQDDGPFLNSAMLTEIIPSRYDDWSCAVRVLEKYDPDRLFSNSFLDSIFASK